MFNYVVTAFKSSSVSHTLTGNFTGPKDLNLIVEKTTYFEIYRVMEQGLETIMQVPVYGKIEEIFLIKPPNSTCHQLVICTNRYSLLILAYDSVNQDIITVASGDIEDRIGRPCEGGPFGIVDPKCRTMAFHISEGLLKVIPFDRKTHAIMEAFNIRMEELYVVDIVFLESALVAKNMIFFDNPTIAVLFQDTKQSRHIKTYQINVEEKQFRDGPFQQLNLLSTTRFLIPVPASLGGLLVISSETVTYHSGSQFKAIAFEHPTQITCHEVIDGNRWLLGDTFGNLYIFGARRDYLTMDVTLEKIGVTSIASSISYLDNGYVFIGSSGGDSQLVRFASTGSNSNQQQQQQQASGSGLMSMQVKDVHVNLGPIVHFCVVDLEREGQCQIVTCSGRDKDGTIRIVRNGIGIEEQANIEMEGIKGMWSLKDPSSLRPNLSGATTTTSKKFDKYVVVTFIRETRLLGIEDDNMKEVENIPFTLNQPTLVALNVSEGGLLQVTPRSIRVIDCNFKVADEWFPPKDMKIVDASANPTQVVVTVGGGRLLYFELHGLKVVEKTMVILGNEISCLNINPLFGEESSSFEKSESKWVVVGMWNEFSIKILELPTLKVVAEENLQINVLIRSVLLMKLEGIDYVFCGIGDGSFCSFHLDSSNGNLSSNKKIILASKPIALVPFLNKNSWSVFAYSDRPVVIFSNNQKLLFSNVNLKEVNAMCAFDCESFPDSLAVSKENSFMIGNIDEIQKLHVRTIKLEEQPNRIVYQKQSHSFLISTVKKILVTGKHYEVIEQGFVKLLDENTFDVLHEVKLDNTETCCACASMQFQGDQNTYYVAGTTSIIPEELQPSQGRLLIFEVKNGKLHKVAEHGVKGAIYAVANCNGKLAVATNSTLQIYKWKDSSSLSSTFTSSSIPSSQNNNNNNKNEMINAVSHRGGGDAVGDGTSLLVKDDLIGTRELSLDCETHVRVVTVALQTRGDFIIVGDVMKSLTLFVYKSAESQLEKIAEDLNPIFVQEIAFVDDEHFLVCDAHYNLVTLTKNTESMQEEDRRRLAINGFFHLGDQVNVVSSGSLVMRTMANDNEYSKMPPTLLFGTVNGMIGILACLPEKAYIFFQDLQQAMTQVVKGVGGLSHGNFREYFYKKKRELARNFLDGDLIESFLDLRENEKEDVVARMKDKTVTVKNVIERIEDLQLNLH